MNKSKRSILLHFHMFKNAGTTIDWILKNNFLSNAIQFDPEIPSNVNSEEILNHLNQHPHAKSFSSHQIQFPIPQNSEFEFLPIVFVRHPIDRALSIYSFNKNRLSTMNETPGSKQAKILSIKDYFRWELENKNRFVMKNFQVRFLSSTDNSHELENSDLEISKMRFKQCVISGVVNRMNDSLVVAEKSLRKYFPSIDLSYIKQNVSIGRKDTLEERLTVVKSEIGEDLITKLEKSNSLDLELFSFANKLLNEKIKTLENYEKDLIDFKEKNDNLNRKS